MHSFLKKLLEDAPERQRQKPIKGKYELQESTCHSGMQQGAISE